MSRHPGVSHLPGEDHYGARMDSGTTDEHHEQPANGSQRRRQGIEHGHSHGHSHAPTPRLHDAAQRALWPAVGLLAAATVIAALLLWPSGSNRFEDPLLLDADPSSATVVVVDPVACAYEPTQPCTLIGFELNDGANAGEFGAFELGANSPLDPGDKITVTSFESVDGELVYSFFDYQRGWPMLWLLGLFAVAVVTLGRWRGVGAIAGLAFSLLVIVMFTLPAILAGSNAIIVAVVSASLIAYSALFLAHGFNPATAVALLSTLASLVLTAVLATAFVGLTNLTGLTDESSLLLAGISGGIDPRGILLAGILIGSLGVLDDVTVTQVSAVWQLKNVQPDLTTTGLMKPALRIGRDHISSTVNTLFLAYAGAALPLLLLFTEAGQSIGNVLSREIVATEFVRTLVGSIGLVASVPLSTWLAAVVLSHRPTVAASTVRPTT